MSPHIAAGHIVIDPLSDRPVTCNHQCQDITLACFESILCEATFEPTHSTTACEWVNLESPHRGRRIAVNVQHDDVVNGGVVGWGAVPQRSAIISFISVASMAGSSHRTPSPVVTRWRPICPSVMQRTNLSQGVSPWANSTHALAVLYRNSSLPIQREAFQVS